MVNKDAVIVIADDDADMLRILSRTLQLEGFHTVAAQDGAQALSLVHKHKPDLIILDIMMPGIDGFAAAKRLKKDEKTSIIPIIMVTAFNETDKRIKALGFGVEGFLGKPFDDTELHAMVNSLLKVKAYNEHMRHHQIELEAEVAKRTRELQQALESLKVTSLDTIHRLSRAAEYKDRDTGSHIHRVSSYTSAIARSMGLGRGYIELVRYAAPMHDIGKVGIPDFILQKPGRLSDDEWRVMKKHTLIGARILSGSDVPVIKMAETIALTHHEKWDGSGYPEGLKGTSIPLAGRITAVADAFDALTSPRCYRGAYSAKQALDIIHSESGSHFDPHVVRAFLAIEDEILAIKEELKDEEKDIAESFTDDITQRDMVREVPLLI